MENPTRGIALILASSLLFSCSDVLAKYLGAALPPVEIGWIRYATFVVFALALRARSSNISLTVHNPIQQVIRGVMLVASSILFIFAIRTMPLADAASVGFVSPLMITILSIPMLGEVVGIRRWTAVCVGFLGVLAIVRPGTGAFQPAALLVLASSLAWSFATILTRKMADSDHAATTMLWAGVTGLVLLSLLLPFDFVTPSLVQVALAVLLGLVATIGQYLMVLAYRHAGAALLAPFSYIQLIYATFFGWLVFHALPDEWTAVGAVIISASGIYTVHRERLRARERAIQAREVLAV